MIKLTLENRFICVYWCFWNVESWIMAFEFLDLNLDACVFTYLLCCRLLLFGIWILDHGGLVWMHLFLDHGFLLYICSILYDAELLDWLTIICLGLFFDMSMIMNGNSKCWTSWCINWGCCIGLHLNFELIHCWNWKLDSGNWKLKTEVAGIRLSLQELFFELEYSSSIRLGKTSAL